MVTMNGFTITPNHRQNRRRERPGSRSRRLITRKSSIQNEYTEGLLDAYDSSISLPSDKARPSPLLRENFHQNWQRWKAREAEEKALQLENLKLEQAEQQRLVVMSLFGDIDYIDP
ncbi:hypothetical protein LOCC1_G005097 [Lachnellula occidentalis]|uniref:Uncharacterized protein n=1 Tax=Lachnellula occidentalis TaxID=215460 RepID=A0A8H8RZ97_9HELO|nr:hypothetical protein LOCC1_G005097 [Lachnellula occidentalis]